MAIAAREQNEALAARIAALEGGKPTAGGRGKRGAAPKS
jgi:BMFP domain-containing protein YqiC